MNSGRLLRVARWMRVALALGLLAESLHFVLSAAQAHHFARTGLPGWVRPALGLCEAAAAVLFLLPRTLYAGAAALLAVLGVAAALHLALGQDPLSLLYLMLLVALLALVQRDAAGPGGMS